MGLVIKEEKNFYRIIKLKEFRKTTGVTFDIMVKPMIPKVDAIDRVLHKGNAKSPGSVGDIERPWYMHPYQEDNLFVMHGTRYVELYAQEHGRVENFVVTPEYIEHNGEIVCEGGAILTWPTYVFHRIISGDDGSASINLATHLEGIDMKTNFNIYDLNTETGEYRLLREGYKDQK